MVSYSENIAVNIEKVWGHFLFKIEHPQHFVPGVDRVVIHEKTASFVLRSMDLTLPDGNKSTVTEKITWSPYTVNFLITDHPLYTGYVENKAEKITENETRITYSLHWISKQTLQPVENNEVIRNAVRKTIDYILAEKH